MVLNTEFNSSSGIIKCFAGYIMKLLYSSIFSRVILSSSYIFSISLSHNSILMTLFEPAGTMSIVSPFVLNLPDCNSMSLRSYCDSTSFLIISFLVIFSPLLRLNLNSSKFSGFPRPYIQDILATTIVSFLDKRDAVAESLSWSSFAFIAESFSMY